jgi:hypothetical protein
LIHGTCFDVTSRLIKFPRPRLDVTLSKCRSIAVANDKTSCWTSAKKKSEKFPRQFRQPAAVARGEKARCRLMKSMVHIICSCKTAKSHKLGSEEKFPFDFEAISLMAACAP